MHLHLAATIPTHLDTLFEFQTNEEGIYLAAFTPLHPHDRQAYLDKYTRILARPDVHMQSIFVDGRLVGSISKFVLEGQAEITYWLDRAYWGRGVGTQALKQFLTLETTRPLHGRVAFDNFASQRLLEKNGFVKIGTDKGFANARNCEIEEYIYVLLPSAP
jgi:[ribosomal protein S5]-alanine N-acetyltransferase